MKTIALKLSTGEELIARVISDTTDYVIVSHVRVVGLHQDSQGRVGVGMTEYSLTNTDAEVKIYNQHIVCKYETSSEAERSYITATSGIALA